MFPQINLSAQILSQPRADVCKRFSFSTHFQWARSDDWEELFLYEKSSRLYISIQILFFIAYVKNTRKNPGDGLSMPWKSQRTTVTSLICRPPFFTRLGLGSYMGMPRCRIPRPDDLRTLCLLLNVLPPLTDSIFESHVSTGLGVNS